MRSIVTGQMPMLQMWIEHPHAKEYQEIGKVLDSNPEIARLAFEDLVASGVQSTRGRPAMSAEQVVRALVVKQLEGYSYEELAFHLRDSSTLRTFCRIGMADPLPTTSTLQRNFKALRSECLEAVNRVLVKYARNERLESGQALRVDCTATESNVHEPTDSSLLFDCVRVLSRLAGRAGEFVDMRFVDHTRQAKRRAIGILNAKNAEARVPLYAALLEVTRKAVTDALRMGSALLEFPPTDLMAQLAAQILVEQIDRFVELTRAVMDQTHRRVILGEAVPADAKIVSVFEPHTDIIVKDRRETIYGHKICLSGGSSGLILDVVIEDGNPADATLAVRMVQRARTILGTMPQKVAFDGGFASKDNLRQIKEMGVKDVAFSKSRGLPVEQMVTNPRVYRELRNFRAGIEADISLLKRCRGLTRCTWSGLESFKAYVWASILSANLLTIARRRAARARPDTPD